MKRVMGGIIIVRYIFKAFTNALFKTYRILQIQNPVLNLATVDVPGVIISTPWRPYKGSVTILGDLTIHANNFATLNKKNFTSVTPLKLALNFLILALNDSAFALVSLSSKKLRILS